MKDYSSNLSQSERLALAGAPCFIPADSIGADERESTKTKPVKLSRHQRRTRALCGLNHFKMPSLDKVRNHDARLTLRGSPVNVAHDDESEDESEDDALRGFAYEKRRDSMRDHSLILPSQRGYAEAWSEARSYGYAND